jgi:hypothetical protein
MRGFGILALTCALVGSTSVAHAGLNFDFSFNDVIGNTGGTVTGEIFGLTDDTTNEAATDLVIYSYPAGQSLPSAPWDIFNAPGYTVFFNDFTVSDGQITAAEFYVVNTDSGAGLQLNQGGGQNSLSDSIDADTRNSGGFAGATYTAVEAPEPTSIALFLSGLFGLRLIRRRKS